MNKRRDEIIELADTINDTPISIIDNTTPKGIFLNSKLDIIYEENTKMNRISNVEKNSSILNNFKKENPENKILLQRENRRIISIIRKTISKREEKNTTILSIKNILINYKNDITLLRDDKKNTLLHIYVELGDISSIKIILEVYIQILNFSKTFYDFLFLKNIENKNVFDIAVKKGDANNIKLLYELIENENKCLNKKEYMNYFYNNIFHIAANFNKVFPILFFYEKLKPFYKFFNKGYILNSHESNKNKMTPIHCSCKNKNVKIVDLFIDLGADIDAQDIKGRTPLHYAVINNDERMVKHLLLRGANKFIKDENKLSPYDLAFSLGDKNLVKILYHKNCCQKQFCEDEIGPLSKKNNSIILLIGLLFTIFIKLLIIFRFTFVLNGIELDFKEIFALTNDFNNTNNNTESINEKSLYLGDFFSCLDLNCRIEEGLIFFTLLIDLLLLLIFIIFKCSKEIYIMKNIESEDNTLFSLYEKNENICVKCRIIINDKIQHCLICDRCVENWDHHCYWLNTCINDKNYTKFHAFVVFTILFLFFNLLFYITCLYLLLSSKEIFVQEIFNLEYDSFPFLVIKIIIIVLGVYLIFVFSYSLIFIALPIIKYLISKSMKYIKKKDLNKNEMEYKALDHIVIDDDDSNKN
jgi:ankyrin repeat protein